MNLEVIRNQWQCYCDDYFFWTAQWSEKTMLQVKQ